MEPKLRSSSPRLPHHVTASTPFSKPVPRSAVCPPLCRVVKARKWVKLNSWFLYGSCTEIKAIIFIRIASSASLRPWATQREVSGAPWEHCQTEKKNRDLSHKGRGEYRFGYLTSQRRNNQLWNNIRGYTKVKTKRYGVRKKAGTGIGNWNSKQGVFVVGMAAGLGVPLS